MTDKNEITGFVLAGGRSLRMGSDKASIVLNDTTFIQRSIDALKPLVTKVLVVSDNLEHDNFGVERIKDLIKDSGPLAGLHAALSYSETKYNIVLSCDVPLITNRIPKLLINEIDDAFDVVQVKSNGKTMPITALYKKRCARQIEDLLLNGERRLRVAVSTLKTKTVKLNSSLSREVTNINTIKELKQIQYAVAD
jgi:molybdopterin-guanine dinucleotide biosynthesis protein A